MKNQILEETTELEEETNNYIPLKFKCKPTFNFQSIEFEMTITNDEEERYMKTLYANLLDFLKEIAPEQSSAKAEPIEPATPKQIEILKKFHIKYKPNVSKQEANELIQKSMNK